jgi:hypothetical protein
MGAAKSVTILLPMCDNEAQLWYKKLFIDLITFSYEAVSGTSLINLSERLYYFFLI